MYQFQHTSQKSSNDHGVLSSKNGGGHETSNNGTEDAAHIGNSVVPPGNIGRYLMKFRTAALKVCGQKHLKQRVCESDQCPG